MPSGAEFSLSVPQGDKFAQLEPSAPYLPPQDDEEGGIDLSRYIAALLRHKLLVIGLGLAGLAAGFGVSRLVKPIYNAQATISIDVSSRNATQSSPIRNAPLLESQAWIDLLRSFQVLDEVVRRRHLFLVTPIAADRAYFANFSLNEDAEAGTYEVRPEPDGSSVTLARADGIIVERAAVGDSIGRSLGFVWVAPQLPAGRTVQFIVRTPRDAAVMLNQSLEAALPPQNASILRLQLRGEDPRETAATLNTIAERFVEFATILKREKLVTSSEVLSEQLASAYADLRAAESTLESFRVRTITLPSERGATQIAPGLTETRDPVRNAFFQLRIDRDALARDRDAIQRAVRSGRDSSALLLVTMGSIPSVVASGELSASLADLGTRRAEARALSIGFSPAHPPLAQLLRQIAELEQRTIPAQAASLIESLNQRISDLDERIAASTREMQQMPTRAIEQARHEGNLDIAQSLYSQLRASYEQAILAERSASPDVRVLDRAVPPTVPVSDQLLMVIVGGLVGGLGLGVVLALLLDHFDRRFRYPAQVTRELGLPILGALPLVRAASRGGDAARAEEQTHLTEALRSVRMNLAYAHGAAGTLMTTITSPGSGDGKSFTSSNLARSFASAGHRVLLIDGDTRRGHLHRTLGVTRQPGLLDLLTGTASRAQVVQHIAEPGFDFIACGTRSAGGPELLSSSTMAQLMMSLRADYSVILVDSPPLGAGVDPMVLGALCGSMIMVLRTGVTDRELAEARLQDLERLPIRVLGAILNDVKAEGIYRYYSYLPGYGAEDEVSPAPDKQKRRSLLGRG